MAYLNKSNEHSRNSKLGELAALNMKFNKSGHKLFPSLSIK